jgi:hypothetical protein
MKKLVILCFIFLDKFISILDWIYNIINPPRDRKKILSIVFMILLFNNCTIPLPPVGEGVTRYQVKNLALFFDFDNGIFWASSGPGEGHEIRIYKEYYFYRFSLGPNSDHFERMVINRGDRFMVVVGRETTEMIVRDTLLEEFYRVRFSEVVVDFDLSLGRIYYHAVHQETYEIEVTNLEGGSFLVDRRSVGCYESKASHITNLKKGKEYGVTVKQGGKTVEYQKIRFQ